MKKIIHPIIFPLLLIFFVTSCMGYEELNPGLCRPSIITSKDLVSVDYKGGAQTVNVTLENGHYEVSIHASSQESWIKDIKISEHYLLFNVDENYSDQERNGKITISYGKYVTTQVNVKQERPVPIIKTSPDSAAIDYKGGYQSLTYSIENPYSGVSLTASSTDYYYWISNIKVESDKVTYYVPENTTESERSGKITLSYGSYATKEFFVKQTWQSTIRLEPESATIDYMGGSQSLTYYIDKPHAGVNLTASSTDNWIQGCKVESDKVNYSVAANISINSRTSNILLTYGSYASKNFTITQSGQPVTSLSLNKTSTTLTAEDTESLKAAVSPSDATLTWSSSNSTVATVDQSGKVTALGVGSATITVTASTLSASCEVTVLKATPSFYISPTSMSLKQNGASGTIQITSNSDCVFTASSNNNSVAQVSVSDKAVYVQPCNAGTATITIGCPETSRYKSVSSLYCSVSVLPVTDLSSNGTANCYIVPSAGNYRFKATVKGGSSESVGTPSSAAVLWESFGTSTTPSVGDIVKNVSYSGGYIAFETPSSLNNGNAVIAVKDASGNILWSWHIWVCKDFDPAMTAHVYNNNAGTMMDRNLGATSATPGDVHALGLLYQWGRKDPFLSGCQISYSSWSFQQQAASTLSWPYPVASDANNGTISYAVAHPTTFITNNSSNYDWYYTGSSSTDNTRWQTSNKEKGMYDPCPVGWRVPDGGDYGIWSKAFGSSSIYEGPWDDTNKGVNFGSGNGQSSSHQLGSASTIWYPATGYRNYDDGSLRSVGNFGYYWSCTPSARAAYILDFGTNGYVSPSNNCTRVHGLSVRCIQE